MKLSVVVPFFNHRQFLAESLGAIFSQTKLPDECILIDDGSTDGSEKLFEKFLHLYPTLKILRNEKNLGVHATANRGIIEAKGEWIALCAADDLLYPDFFERCSNIIERYPEIGLCCGDMATFENRLPYRFHRSRALPVEREVLLDPKLMIKLCRSLDFVIKSNAALYRKDLLIRYGLYEQNLKSLADFYLCYQIALRHPIVYIPELFSAYRLMPHSYGNRIRFDFRARSSLFSTLLQRIWKEEDRNFRRDFNRAGVMSFGGYFYLLFLALRPNLWWRLVAIFPFVFRTKVKRFLQKKEGDFGPLHQYLFFSKRVKKIIDELYSK